MDVVFAGMADHNRAVTYTEYVRSLLTGRALEHLEALLSTDTFPFHNALTQRYINLGKAEGKAEGVAESVLHVLQARGIAMSHDERHRITSCTDAELLDAWLTRAIKVQSAAELFIEPVD